MVYPPVSDGGQVAATIIHSPVSAGGLTSSPLTEVKSQLPLSNRTRFGSSRNQHRATMPMLERDGGFLYLFDEVGDTRGFISDSLNHYFELFRETINHLVTNGAITRSNMDRYNTSNRQLVMFAFSSPRGPCSIHLSCHHDKTLLGELLGSLYGS